MASGKNSFILYSDYIHTAENLPDDVAGRLYKTILQYVNDRDPQPDELLVKVAFEPIKQQLKRDLKEWESAKEKRADAGRKGGLAKASNTKQDLANGSNDKKELANLAVTVNDTVTVNVTDTVKEDKKDIAGRMKDFYESLKPYVEEFSKETVREFYEYWTEHSPKGRKMRFEKETVFDIKRRLVTWKNNEKKKFAGGGAKTGKKKQITDVVKPAYQNLMEKFENEGK